MKLHFIIIFTCFSLFLHSAVKEAALEQDNDRVASTFESVEEIYELGENENWRDVTDRVLASRETSEESKMSIRAFNRRIIVFKYPSDGLSIKGFLSYTPNPEHHPLLILYRWGNQDFALMNPGVIFATYKDYTVISSTLRGGISEGKDEFGGADVDDMNNLIAYMPKIGKEIGIQLKPSCVFMLGPSRGGLEMFLTLARFPKLQKKVNKVVALSSILDLNQLIHDRPGDMKTMLEKQYGLQDGAKRRAWIAMRNPIDSVAEISKSLPILIIQGTADDRISLAEGYHMVQALKEGGRNVNYWEIKNGNHTLLNTPFIMNDIATWLESNSPCMSIHIPRKKDE